MAFASEGLFLSELWRRGTLRFQRGWSCKRILGLREEERGALEVALAVLVALIGVALETGHLVVRAAAEGPVDPRL